MLGYELIPSPGIKVQMNNPMKAGVVGAGFVGTAHSVFLSQFYDSVTLVDRDERLVENLARGIIPFSSSDPNLNSLFTQAIKSHTILPTSDILSLQDLDIIFICVGLDFYHESNGFENLDKLFTSIGSTVKSSCLIVLETTVPPGTSDKVVLPALRRSSPDNRFFYVYSYERVMPGPSYLKSIEELPKVYAACSDESCALYEAHLELVAPKVSHKLLKSFVSVELSKVLENSYRMINIAIIQEFAKFSRQLGAELNDILECIRERPTHSNIRYPGLAPGGYCLTKDPRFLYTSAELNEIHPDFPILSAAVDTVDLQNSYVSDYVCSVIEPSETIDFLGLAYLAGVGDLRGSSSLTVFQDLVKRGYTLIPIDPFVATNSDAIESISLSNAPSSDTAIIATAHPDFNHEFLSNYSKIIDINACLNSAFKKNLQKSGITVIQYGG